MEDSQLDTDLIAAESHDVDPTADRSFLAQSWTVGKDGISIFRVSEGTDRWDLWLYEFATARTRKLAPVDLLPWVTGTSVSPDGRAMLYPQTDEPGSDLMLVENFR